jgi:hypothetical protein
VSWPTFPSTKHSSDNIECFTYLVRWREILGGLWLEGVAITGREEIDKK